MEGMKAITIKIVAFIALAILAGGCNNQEKKDQETIIKVLQARKVAIKEGFAIVRVLGRNSKIQDRKHTLRNLKQVEMLDCPEEFKEAWLAYIQAWERFATPSPTEQQQKHVLARPTSRSVDAKIGVGIGAHYESTHENNVKLAEKLEAEDTSEALRLVERVALKFKVDALKYE